MSGFLFYTIVRTKFRVEKNYVGGVCRELTGAELLEIVRETLEKPTASPVEDKKALLTVWPEPLMEGAERWRPPEKRQPDKETKSTVLTCSEPLNPYAAAPLWARRIIEMPLTRRKNAPWILDYLKRCPKVFAELSDGAWYIKRQGQVAACVKPALGLQYMWMLLVKDRPVETSELIGAGYSFAYDDDDGPYQAFGKSGWEVTWLFDEEKEYDRIYQSFSRAIRAIGKVNAELGCYFQLALQKPTENGEGWILQDHDPETWVLPGFGPRTRFQSGR
jgi:hypothetical protein